jgi:membrane associated rhomboid family serine protease
MGKSKKNKASRDKKQLMQSIWFPLLFTAILWIVKVYEAFSNHSLAYLGLHPLDIEGLRGILFSPLIHGSWEHLFNNTIPVFVLSWALFYFYRSISFKVFLLIYFVHGFWLWFLGRDSYHIGASGIIHGLGAFIFVSGIIRKNSHLLSISLLVAFLYGGMVWGIFPIEENISWESHLTGMVAGIIFAFYYKNYGPPSNFQRIGSASNFEIEEIEEDDENDYWNDPEYKQDEKGE